MRCALVVTALAASCRLPAPAPPPIEMEITWRLVERVPADNAGDAQVAPVPILVLDPEPPEIVTRMIREQAGVGEPAEMEIQVLGAGRTRVRLRPSRRGVRILGPDIVELDGGRPLVVRFTCDSPGRASVLPQVAFD